MAVVELPEIFHYYKKKSFVFQFVELNMCMFKYRLKIGYLLVILSIYRGRKSGKRKD